MSTIVECIEAEPMVASGSIVGNTIAPAVVGITAVASETVIHTITSLAQDAAAMTAGIASEYRRLLFTDTAAMSAQIFQKAEVADLFEVRGRMRASVFSRIGNFFVDPAQMSANVLDYRIVSLANDQAAMSATLLPKVVLNDLFVSRGTMAAEAFGAITVLFTDTAAMSAQILGSVHAKGLFTDTAAMSAQILSSLQIKQLVEDTAAMSATVMGTLTAYNLLESRAAAYAEIIDHQPMVAWSAPTDSLAMTRYTLPRLNSVALAGDQLLLASADGVFARGGTADDGAPVAAYAKTSLMDFGDDKLKRPDAVYVGYSTSGAVQLQLGATRAVSGSNGTERTWNYTNGPHTYASPTGGRFKAGRGIESRYFRFTITNVAGSSLELRGLKFTYLPMSRRF